MAEETRCLSLTLYRAVLNRPRAFFQKKPPYAVVELGNTRKTIQRGESIDNAVVWNEALHFSYTHERLVFIKFFHDDLMSDNYIGEAVVPISAASEGYQARKLFPIVSKGRNKGSVELNVSVRGTLSTPRKVRS